MFAQVISPGAWPFFLIMGGGAGLLLGIVGIFIRLAVRDSYLVLAACLVLCVLGLCLPWFLMLFLITDPFRGEGYLWLTFPLFIGLPAFLLSQLPEFFRWLGERLQGPLPMVDPKREGRLAGLGGRTLRIALVLAVGAAAVGLTGYFVQIGNCMALERLLTGDGQVEVAAVRFGRQPGLLLNDPESTRYLTTALRSAMNEGYYPSHGGNGQGPNYTLEVSLASRGSVKIDCEVHEKEDGFLLNFYPRSEDPIYFWVRLPSPMPAAVAEALRKLR